MVRHLAVGVLAAALSLPAAAQEVLTVFQSPGDNGVGNPNVPLTIPTNGVPVAINVYYSGGTVAPTVGQECVGGTGSEVCGVDFEIQTVGLVTLTGFTPAGAPGDVVFNQTAALHKGNAGNPLTGNVGATKYGTIMASATGGGSVQVVGKHWVNSSLGLRNVVPLSLAVAGGPDFDSDGVFDADDECPTITDAGADADMDGIDNACDTCTSVANVFTGSATNRTIVSGTLDDDGDGRGNLCDFDTDNTGTFNITPTDFNNSRASQGKQLTLNTCGSGGNERCYEYDFDGTGTFNVTPTDFNLARAAQGKQLTLYPKCTACAPPFSRAIGDAGGAPTAGRPVCVQNGTAATANVCGF